MREVKKNVVFQRKTGKIQLETVVFKRKTGEIGENLRKRKESEEKEKRVREREESKKKEVPLTRPKDMRDGQRSGTDTK